MKIPRTITNAVDTQFDEWAKAVAHGLTRRKTLQLIGGTFTGVLLTLRGPRAWAAPSTGGQGCGHICAPLFSPHNQGAFAACTHACEDCKSCRGTPTMSSTQMLICNNATPCRNGGGLACCSSDQNCCNNVCCTGDCCQGNCYSSTCPAGQSRDPQTCQCTCNSGIACGEGCCSTGQECCGGNCLTPCSAGTTRDPSTCMCVGSTTNSGSYTCDTVPGGPLACGEYTCDQLRQIAIGYCYSNYYGELTSFTCAPCTLA